MQQPALAAGLHLKLRRVAARKRQQDIAPQVGISTTRYSAIERGEAEASDLERQLLDQVLPALTIAPLAVGTERSAETARKPTLHIAGNDRERDDCEHSDYDTVCEDEWDAQG
jgi:transcriptional regulator with XRE-family HTH domain